MNDEDKKTKVVAVPELQETSAMPCDTGSETKELKKMFGDKVEWDWLDEDGGEVGPRKEWTSKKGPWAGDGNALEKRARWVRRWLKKVSEEVPTRQKEKQRHIVCVLHGGVSYSGLRRVGVG